MWLGWRLELRRILIKLGFKPKPLISDYSEVQRNGCVSRYYLLLFSKLYALKEDYPFINNTLLLGYDISSSEEDTLSFLKQNGLILRNTTPVNVEQYLLVVQNLQTEKMEYPFKERVYGLDDDPEWKQCQTWVVQKLSSTEL